LPKSEDEQIRTSEKNVSHRGKRFMKRIIEAAAIQTENDMRAETACVEVAHASRARIDPMRRFAPVPYSAVLPVMGSSVRLETNSSKLLTHMVELFAQYEGQASGRATFQWRIIVDDDVAVGPPWPWRSAFSGDGLRFAQFGQRNFVAVDLVAREAVAFVAAGLLEDGPGFTSPFIDTLFYMTTGSLGLVPIVTACVSSGTKGLLVMGAPNQGKTTASYLATGAGLTFHADQSVFLEMASGELRAWGDFVPIAFRPETLHFLPELASRTRAFSYCDFNFFYMDKHKRDSRLPGFVMPICCVFLQRECASVPRLTRLAKSEFSDSLSRYVAFKDDDRFEELRLKTLTALAHVPAYQLAYGSDPATAVPFLAHLLTRHDV
jgi:hypothetical protein